MTDLNYLVELWETPEMARREDTLAACSNLYVARAAYEKAKELYPTRLVTSSNKAMVMAKSLEEPPPSVIPMFRQTDD